MIVAGESAYWYQAERVTRCVGCHPLPAKSDPAITASAARPQSTTALPVTVAAVVDVAGGSAQREYDKRSTRELAKKDRRVVEDAEWRAAIRDRRPVLGWIATTMTARPQITPESQPTMAWKVGADGERHVASVLTGVAGIDVLHDRLVPRSGANIDHMVVGPSGVFVIDSKKYTGQIEVRDVGSFFRADDRLYVNGKDRSKLVDGVLGQVEEVREVLGERFAEIAVHGVLCFVDGDWGWSMRPKSVNGVTVVWPKALPKHVSLAGDFGSQVAAIADHLRRHLRPAVRP
jgi:Nuclease-related domain